MAPRDAASLPGTWLVVPEVPHVAGPGAPSLAVALDYARFHGLRSAAVFYDLIPLRFPGYEAMAAEHARYARALAGADLVLGISRDCTEDLRRWWAEEGRDPARLPRLRALPLPEEMPNTPRVTEANEPPAPPVRFLSFGTLEPRKNQVEAMRAFSRLRARRPDLDMRFDLVGNVHGGVAAAVQEIAAREPRIRLHRYLPDDELRALVQASHATVFVSQAEGYGLPVAESLWLGRPCLCSDHGSVAEIAAGGGCLAVSAADPAAIESGFERLASDPELRARLAAEARARPLRRWGDYADAAARRVGGGTASAAHRADRGFGWRRRPRAARSVRCRGAPSPLAPGLARAAAGCGAGAGAARARRRPARRPARGAAGHHLRRCRRSGGDRRRRAGPRPARRAGSAARPARSRLARNPRRRRPRPVRRRRGARRGAGRGAARAAAYRDPARALPRRHRRVGPQRDRVRSSANRRRRSAGAGAARLLLGRPHRHPALQHRRAARDAPPRRRAGAARGGGGAGEVGRGSAPHRADLRRRRAKPSPASTARRFGPARRCRNGSPASGCCCPRSRSATPRRRAARSASRAAWGCAPPPCSTT